MNEQTQGTTPRPWHVVESRVVSTSDPLPGHRFRTVGDFRYRNGGADAALTVEAVNAYDRLRAVEAAARAYVAWQYREKGAPRVTLTDLREALAVR